MDIEHITNLLKQNNRADALKSCKDLLVKNSTSAELYNILGILNIQENNLAEGINCFRQAIYYAKNDASYYNNLSNALKKQGDLAQARQYLHHAITLSPNYAEAFNNLGSLYYTEGRYQEAIPYFEKAIRLNPNYYEPHYNLANSLIKENLIHQAISHYQTVIKMQPHHLNAQQNLAMAYITIGNLTEALPYLEMAVQNNPEHAELHAQLADLYLEFGNTVQAIALLEKALSLAPQQATWHHNLAILYLREQNREQALLHFKATLDKDPNNQTACHMVNALTTTSIENAPMQYVTDLFNQYAQFYNRHVKEKLNYKVPELLRQAIGNYYQERLKTMQILDIGCGTGLCSIYFRELAQYLVGIDISIEMLLQAKALNAYDALCCGNILQSIPGEAKACFDLIIAADVLVYCGELEQIFNLCSTTIKVDGIFAFTVEQLGQANYQLQKTGRFAHSAEYIQTLAKKYNLVIVSQQNIVLRMQHNQPILGWLFLLVKQV